LFASVKKFTCLQQNLSGWCNVQKFAAINGILFPGGATSLDDNPFYQTAEKLFKMVIKANDNGDYFPLYGACLGFQLLTVIVSQVLLS
jgi:gamma-glutamyl hydrolase